MTRLLSIGVAVVAGLASCVQAEVAPSVQPAKPTVLVLSFSTPTDSAASWIGRAAKDDVVAGLKKGLDATVRTPSVNRAVADSAAALKLGQQYHANYVIYGYAQEVDTIARITGQVFDVETGQPIGGLKVTGPATSILDIDDALTAQAMASLPQSIVKPEAFAALQKYWQPVAPDIDEPAADGLAMISQSYPVGSTTFLAPMDDGSAQQIQNVSYVYAPTIIVSPGYGYGGAFAPDYSGPGFGYVAPIFTSPHRHGHLPVIHHGPQHPDGPRGVGNSAGIVIGGGADAGSNSSEVTFSWGQNPGRVGAPFMGGGQSFPAQNGFVTSGASAGFAPLRFNSMNFRGGFGGRTGFAGR